MYGVVCIGIEYGKLGMSKHVAPHDGLAAEAPLDYVDGPGQLQLTVAA